MFVLIKGDSRSIAMLPQLRGSFQSAEVFWNNGNDHDSDTLRYKRGPASQLRVR